jgi:hypothetical protein
MSKKSSANTKLPTVQADAVVVGATFERRYGGTLRVVAIHGEQNNSIQWVDERGQWGAAHRNTFLRQVSRLLPNPAGGSAS